MIVTMYEGEVDIMGYKYLFRSCINSNGVWTVTCSSMACHGSNCVWETDRRKSICPIESEIDAGKVERDDLCLTSGCVKALLLAR